MHYSLFSLVGNALTGHRRWQRAWRDPAPKSEYDVVIVGAGGHGLATAYYLAKNHGVTDIAVLEKGWLGGRNTGRNTTVVRSNYLWDDSAHLYEHSLKLWEGLSQELNFNVMFSQRGVVFLAQTRHELREMNRRVGALPLDGIDSEMLNLAQVKRQVPVLDSGVMSGQVHVYVSQSDKGELVIGASRDNYNSYAQRGSLPIVEEQLAALVELFPIVSRLRMLRQWAGIVDCAPDASPIIGLTPVDGLFVNCGWGTGGFKATPGSGWVFADTIPNDRPHKLNQASSLV